MGNVLPLIGWGRALRDRGHRVTLVGEDLLSKIADREGFGHLAVGLSPMLERNRAGDRARGAWDRLQLLRSEYEWVLRGSCAALMPVVQDKDVVVAAPYWVVGARIACERHGAPLATVYLQPWKLPRDPDAEPGKPWFSPFQRVGRGIRQKLGNLAMARKLNIYRRELGMSPVRRPLEWWNSPDAVLAFFPDWFSPRQRSWPAQLQHVGFPLFDRWDSDWKNEELDNFLAAGDPPLVFSQSSNATEDRSYIDVSIAAAERLKRRAVILTTMPEQLPNPLPSHVRYFGFVPISVLLPRSAAFIHHGGVGTLSQTLAAAVPQLVVPQIWDQPDNCRWLAKLGVSRQLTVQQYRVDQVTEQLKYLLESDDVREKCRNLAQQIPVQNSFDAACESLERLGRS
jgi:UDP:flavonoid glycosyltransferase YjiC (YdhE family)